MTDETLAATLHIPAPADAVFAALADPSRHDAIDGTGWVREALDKEPLASSGQVFRMGMYHDNHPDGHYQMANRVEVLDPPRAISWQPGQEVAGTEELRFGGWVWRYDLAAAGDGTDVTLTYDWSAVPGFVREYISFPPFGREHLENSLGHLSEIVTG